MFRFLNKREPCHVGNCNIGKYILDIKCGCLNCIRQKSYYQALGLDSTASPKDIKSAYYKLSIQFHPDKNNGCPDSVAKFREISEAYEVLGNPERKKSYDQGRHLKSYHSHNYTTQNGYYYKPYYARHRYRAPFTGKTKDFDYDEHLRQHYEKEWQEYEYVKRRWEAEFNRRHPDHEYFRNRYKHTDRENSYEEFSTLSSMKRRTIYLFIPIWCLFFILVPIFHDFRNPDKYKQHYPLYYHVRRENEGTVENNK